jgi:hypothetical protein
MRFEAKGQCCPSDRWEENAKNERKASQNCCNRSLGRCTAGEKDDQPSSEEKYSPDGPIRERRVKRCNMRQLKRRLGEVQRTADGDR